MNRALVVLALLAGLIAGCQQPGKVYDIAPQQAAATLTGSTIPAMMLGGTFRVDPAIRSGDTIVWALRKDDDADGSGDGHQNVSAAFRLVAHLFPAGSGTRIVPDVEPGGSVTPAEFASRTAKVPQLVGLLNAITAEQVASTLGHRNFDVAAINSQLMLVMVSMLPAIRDQMQQAGKDEQTREHDTAEQADHPSGTDEREEPQTRVGQGRAIQAADDTRPVDDTRPANDGGQ